MDTTENTTNKKNAAARWDIAFGVLGLLMAASEAAKQVLLFREAGGYQWWYLPFQMCSVPMYAALLIGLSRILPGRDRPAALRWRRWAYAWIMDFGLLGGVFAFMDTSGMHYTQPVLTVHSFAWHVLLVVMALLAGGFRLGRGDAKSLGGALLLFGACCGIAEGLNVLCAPYGILNMFYISPLLPMTQVGFEGVYARFGNALAIPAYIGILIFGGVMIHGMWAVGQGRHPGRRTASENGL